MRHTTRGTRREARMRTVAAATSTRATAAGSLLRTVCLVAAIGAGAADAQDTVPIAAGKYLIGDGVAGTAGPAHRVELAAFHIDRYEVTNRQFSAYLDALDIVVHADAAAGDVPRTALGGPDAALVFHGPPHGSERPHIELDDSDARIGLRDERFAARPGFEDHPVTEVTWFGARAYCRWRGGRLPSEAEWEAAARGPGGRTYPWGEHAPTRELAVYGRRRGDTAPVGSRPRGATPEGVHDLAGSLAEWTSSLYRPYPYRRDDGREDPQADGERVTRGGDYVFDSSPEALRTWFRGGFSRAPDRGHRHIGFRCVVADRQPAR